MYQKEIYNLYNIYNQEHKKFHLDILKNPIKEGQIRYDRGLIVESFIQKLWNDIGTIKNTINNSNKKKHKVFSISGKFAIEKGLDINLYSNDVLCGMVECKAYVDSCYLERADSDAKELKRNGYSIPMVIVGLEDATADEASNYWMENKNLDHKFILLDGKRVSSRPIYKEQFFKELNYDKFKNLCEWMFLI